MEVKMTLEELDAAIAKAKKEGYNEGIDFVARIFKEAYDDMTSGFFKRLGRETNIEFARRAYNIVIKLRKQ